MAIDSALPSFFLSASALKRHILSMCDNTCLGCLSLSRAESKRATRKVGLIAHIFSRVFLALAAQKASSAPVEWSPGGLGRAVLSVTIGGR